MPTYQYQCMACGHELEEFQSMSEPPLTTCPSCNGETLRRILGSGAGLIFKGSGFYLTDYRKSPEKGTPGEGGATREKKEPKADPSGGGSKPGAGESSAASSGSGSGPSKDS